MLLKGLRSMSYFKSYGAIRTTSRIGIGETCFSVTYGVEVMSLVEVGLLSPRRIYFNEVSNDELRR